MIIVYNLNGCLSKKLDLILSEYFSKAFLKWCYKYFLRYFIKQEPIHEWITKYKFLSWMQNFSKTRNIHNFGGVFLS